MYSSLAKQNSKMFKENDITNDRTIGGMIQRLIQCSCFFVSLDCRHTQIEPPELKINLSPQRYHGTSITLLLFACKFPMVDSSGHELLHKPMTASTAAQKGCK